jgi:electron-transferring-flavoprotein dehydrogenase
MLVAEAAFEALAAGREGDALEDYPRAFEKSWLHEELHRARNFKPWMSKGLYAGTIMVGVDQVVFRGKAPWTLTHRHADHETLKPGEECQPIAYPKPDGLLTFDRLSSVFISNTHHEEDQPSHLTLRDPEIPVKVNLAVYAGPESRYCPAGVYEFVTEGGNPRLQINAANCVHCKTCDIADPYQIIDWVVPEGGGGPNYEGM